MSYKVLIPSEISEEGIVFLRERGCEINRGTGTTPEAIRRDVVDCDAILARTELYPAEVLEAAPRLKVIARHGVGVDNIDVAAAERLGIWVTVAGTANFNTVAEVGLGFIIALGRQTGFFERNAKSGNWAVRNKISSIDLEGKTLGLIGFGKIGRCLADKARLGLGMNVLAYDPYVTQDQAAESATMTSDWDEVFRRADFVSLHLPYTGKKLVSARDFANMKPTAYFINLARGEIVEEPDLIEALRRGQIAGAALDVFDKEPPDPKNPLLSMENVLVTPHNAGLTRECMSRLSLQAAQGIWDVLSGQVPQWPVNTPKQPVCT